MKVLPPITIDEYHFLEVYYFKLSEYANTDTYEKLPIKKKTKIDRELAYIGNTLDILYRLFTFKGQKEKPIVAWKRVLDEDENWQRIYFFSCRKVAALALGVNRNKISNVICGYRQHTGGYIFINAEDYFAQEDTIGSPTEKWYNSLNDKT